MGSARKIVQIPKTDRYVAVAQGSDQPSDAARLLALSVSLASHDRSIAASALVDTLKQVWSIDCDEDDLIAEFDATDANDDDDLPCRRSCAISPQSSGVVEVRDAAALRLGLEPVDPKVLSEVREQNTVHLGEAVVGDTRSFTRLLEIPGALTMAYLHLFITGAGDFTFPRKEALPGGFKRYVGYLLRYMYELQSATDAHLG